jgi:hypothetical protein
MISTRSIGNLEAGNAYVERMSIGNEYGTTNTRIGINCNAPAYTLDVAGTINASSNISSQNGRITMVGADTLFDLWNFCSIGQNNSNMTAEARGNLILTSYGCNVIFSTSNSNWIFSNRSNGSNVAVVSSNGGLTIANGYRPLYSKITTGTTITPTSNSYGTHYDINTSAITGLSIAYPGALASAWSNDSNGYWVFRNNTGTYLSLAITYSVAVPNIYPSNMIIPPGNSVTLMATYPGGGTNSNYVLF